MASSDYKKVGAFWKSEVAGRKVLQGEIDLDLRGLELSKRDATKVRVTIWPSTDKKNESAPDYTMSAKLVVVTQAQPAPQAYATGVGFFDDPSPPRQPGQDDDLPF
jgi:hypothetical protein